MRLNAREIVDLSVEFMKSKKAQDILVMDLQGLTDTTDYFVLCTGMSDAQVRAISEAIIEGMKGKQEAPWHVEGLEERQWVLLDFVDVVVHIFLPEVREFYNLERLWGDAVTEEIKNDPDTLYPDTLYVEAGNP